ncbi:MAG: hypothetical protein JWM86_2427 [Thermoleophilia bacterium]|nr:hypothetical protein [Thermoleophilia bacterium]
MADAPEQQTHVVIDGRRWRATDPNIPEPLRAELVNELMAARRAVAAALRATDADAEAQARSRLQAAKVALGERGPKWWEQMEEAEVRERARHAIIALLSGREPDATTCPSDAARIAASPDWRGWMDAVRDEARAMHAAGSVEIRQRGVRVEDPATARGPIRIGRGPRFGAPDGD